MALINLYMIYCVTYIRLFAVNVQFTKSYIYAPWFLPRGISQNKLHKQTIGMTKEEIKRMYLKLTLHVLSK